MKKTYINLLLISLGIILSILLFGCGSSSEVNPNTENANVADENTDNSKDIENSNIILLDNEKITAKLSEKTENPQLEKYLIDELDLDETSAKSTRYYYNYVDLNGDGTDEVFVELVGPYTSNTDGNVVYILEKDDDDYFDDIQKLSPIKNPIIISNNKTNGYNDIIVEKSVGTTSKEYVVLKYNGNKYSDINSSESLLNIDDISGIAIISNDIEKDKEQGKGLYLVN